MQPKKPLGTNENQKNRDKQVMFQEILLKSLLSPKSYRDKIRIGKNGDGGYVVSKNHLTKHLISIGCENSTSFEEHYLSIVNESKIDIYDGNSICDLAERNKNVNFYNKNIYSINELNINEPCMIQMDIEGGELFFFEKCDKLNFVEQLVIEIHFHKEQYPQFPILGDYDKWRSLFELFNEYFSLIHIHVNDNGIAQNRPKFFGVYDLLELTYIKKNDSLNIENQSFPIEGLDFPNSYGINPKIDWWRNNDTK